MFFTSHMTYMLPFGNQNVGVCRHNRNGLESNSEIVLLKFIFAGFTIFVSMSKMHKSILDRLNTCLEFAFIEQMRQANIRFLRFQMCFQLYWLNRKETHNDFIWDEKEDLRMKNYAFYLPRWWFINWLQTEFIQSMLKSQQSSGLCVHGKICCDTIQFVGLKNPSFLRYARGLVAK